jgi:CheY-like chemotaxis protein
LSVLLAEDNPVNQRVAAALLSSIGHRVTLCNNGAEAVAALRDGDFDLILMDIQMPVLDGLAATRQIRALSDPIKAGIPVIAISATLRDEDIAGCRASGIDLVLGKPLRLDTLRGMLAQIPRQAAAPPADGSLLDHGQIKALQDALAPRKLAELFGLARQSIAEQAESLRQGWRADDLAQIAAAAHRLAGVARNFGCLALGDIAAGIETAAKQGEASQARQAAFEAALTATLATLPGA